MDNVSRLPMNIRVHLAGFLTAGDIFGRFAVVCRCWQRHSVQALRDEDFLDLIPVDGLTGEMIEKISTQCKHITRIRLGPCFRVNNFLSRAQHMFKICHKLRTVEVCGAAFGKAAIFSAEVKDMLDTLPPHSTTNPVHVFGAVRILQICDQLRLMESEIIRSIFSLFSRLLAASLDMRKFCLRVPHADVLVMSCVFAVCKDNHFFVPFSDIVSHVRRYVRNERVMHAKHWRRYISPKGDKRGTIPLDCDGTKKGSITDFYDRRFVPALAETICAGTDRVEICNTASVDKNVNC